MTDCALAAVLVLLLGIGIGLLHGGKWAEKKEGQGYTRGFRRGVQSEMERLAWYIRHPEVIRNADEILRPVGERRESFR